MPFRSPSSRRAWIEIVLRYAIPPPYAVALLAEGVDRNRFVSRPLLSSRLSVALLAEGVDRNIQKNEIGKISVSRRPPRGGRG